MKMEAYKTELCCGMGAYAQIGEKIGETIRRYCKGTKRK